MNPLLLYIVKSSVYLTGFYLVYFLFLSRDTTYRRNRIYLLFSLIISLILPLFKINTGNSGIVAYFGKALSEIVVPFQRTSYSSTPEHGSDADILNILFRIYIAGVLLFTVKLVTDILRLFIMIQKHDNRGDKLIKFSGLETSGFSALGFIFINRSVSDEESEEIIRHETNHLRLNHFYDIFFIEIVMIFQWFNPFIYMLNRSLRAIHEYQADEGYLKSGISVMRYQSLLFNHVFRTKIFIASNTFSNPALLKKRMIMMTKKRTKRLAYLKMLMVLPVVAIIMAGISACSISKHSSASIKKNASTENPQEDIFVVVEEMPQYPGGETALMDFINKNLEYPKEAKAKNIQGRVICRFEVKADGSIGYVSVLKAIDPLLDAEAIRVLKLMNGWKPGMQGGKPVNVWYSVPIIFQLK